MSDLMADLKHLMVSNKKKVKKPKEKGGSCGGLEVVRREQRRWRKRCESKSGESVIVLQLHSRVSDQGEVPTRSKLWRVTRDMRGRPSVDREQPTFFESPHRERRSF